MGYTTFTGPIRAGNILNTTGTTPGNNVANVGQVVMVQSAALEENAALITTTISIPAYSQILSIEFYATTAFTNSVSIGDTLDPTKYSAAGVIGTGVTVIAPNDAANWINVGYPDSQIVIAGGAPAGAGVGVLTVQYLQGPNGNT